ncbi:hypothetical protein B1H38_13955 [Leptospira borgpetersenii serovar Ballum]|nr:hypothetical protein B1H38_13955 [Leptospira borgpetersenii serovar Ballum]
MEHYVATVGRNIELKRGPAFASKGRIRTNFLYRTYVYLLLERMKIVPQTSIKYILEFSNVVKQWFLVRNLYNVLLLFFYFIEMPKN